MSGERHGDSRQAFWRPNRAMLMKRIGSGLTARPEPPARTTLAVVSGARDAQLLGSHVRDLSLRLDRFAVDQIGALRRVEEQVEAIATAVAAIERGSVKTCEIEGMLIGFPADEWRLVAYCQARGAPEPGTLKLFRELLKPGMRVADVGANVGIYTIAAGLAVGRGGRVYAFEPTPRTASILRANIQLNGLLEQQSVEIRQAAVSSSGGVAQFGLYAGNCGHNTLFDLDQADEVIETAMYTLDQVVEGVLDVVKIDAEGADVAVLKGMVGHVRRNSGIQIIIELAPELLAKDGAGPDELFELVEEMGFEWLLIAEPGGELVRCEREDLAVHNSANLLLRRRSAL